MPTRVTAHAGSSVAAIVMLTGAAISPGAIAAADQNRDNQFLALLAKQQIPAVEGIPSLINEAHQVCRAFDAGFSADAIVNAMLDNAYSSDPKERQFDQGRLTRTEGRFMTAAVQAYCPNHQSKLAGVKVDFMPARHQPTYREAGYPLDAPNSEGAVPVSLIGTIPMQINPPDPPQLPEPPPPTAQTLSPPLPIAASPPPKQVPRQPQPQPQAPPQPAQPPAAAPAPAAPPPPAPPPQAPPPPPPKAPAPPPPPPPPPSAPPKPSPPPPKGPPGFVQLAP